MDAPQVVNCPVKNPTKMHLLGQAFGGMVLKPHIEGTHSSIDVAIYGISGMGKTVFITGTAFSFGVIGNLSRSAVKGGYLFQNTDFAPETYKSLLKEDAGHVDQFTDPTRSSPLHTATENSRQPVIHLMEHPPIEKAISANFVICISDKNGGDTTYFETLKSWAIAAQQTTQQQSVLQQISALPRLSAQINSSERLFSISQLDSKTSQAAFSRFSKQANLLCGLVL